MENTIKRKVNRVGLVGQIVTIILIVLMSVACLACLSGGITLAALPKDAATIGVKGEMDIHVAKSLIGKWINKIPDDPTELNAKLGVNGTEYNDITVEKTASGLMLYASSERFEFRLTRLATAAFSGFVYCAALLVVFVFLKRLCDAFRSCETPFADDVIRRMTVFAWVRDDPAFHRPFLFAESCKYEYRSGGLVQLCTDSDRTARFVPDRDLPLRCTAAERIRRNTLR